MKMVMKKQTYLKMQGVSSIMNSISLYVILE